MVQAVKKDFSNEEKELEKARSQVIDASQDQESDESPDSSAEESLSSEQDQTEAEDTQNEEQPKEDLDETSKQEVDNVPKKEMAEKPLSKRGQKRFRDMAQSLKESHEANAALQREKEDLIRSLQFTSSQDGQDYSEVTADQYERDVANRAEQVVRRTIVRERIEDQKNRAQQQFLKDIEFVTKKYPVLDESSPDYDPKFDTLVGDYYEAIVERDPNARLTDVVEEFVDMREASLDKARKEQAAKVAKQVSKQALSPGGDAPERDSIISRIKDVDSEEDLEKIRREIGTT